MRLTFIPADSMIIINGTPARVDLSETEVPEGLHAIQVYPAHKVSGSPIDGGYEAVDVSGYVECEWSDARRALGNSLGTSGLPGGDAYLTLLQDLHAVVTTPATTPAD